MKDEEEEDTIIEEVDSEKDEIEEFEDVIIASGDQAEAEEARLARNEASNQEADRRNKSSGPSPRCRRPDSEHWQYMHLAIGSIGRL